MVQSAGRYHGGVNGMRGLYRGFVISVHTYAPSSVTWWASYTTTHHLIWRPVMAVLGASTTVAGGAAALVTMPLDTVKTRL